MTSKILIFENWCFENLLKIAAGLLIFFFIFTPAVSAHILKSSGSIGAVMHVSPEDSPIVGQESGFYFEFKDKQNKFKPEHCDCKFTISKDGQQLYTQDLFQNTTEATLTNVTVLYTFPDKGVYAIGVNGEPKEQGQFQPFSLSYDLRVEREKGSGMTNNKQTTSKYVIPIATGAFLLILFIINVRKNIRK